MRPKDRKVVVKVVEVQEEVVLVNKGAWKVRFRVATTPLVKDKSKEEEEYILY